MFLIVIISNKLDLNQETRFTIVSIIITLIEMTLIITTLSTTIRNRLQNDTHYNSITIKNEKLNNQYNNTQHYNENKHSAVSIMTLSTTVKMLHSAK